MTTVDMPGSFWGWGDSICYRRESEVNYASLDLRWSILTRLSFLDKSENVSACAPSPAPEQALAPAPAPKAAPKLPPAPDGPKRDSRASVVVGRFSTSNHWSQVVRGAHYSSAFSFRPPLKTVPRILTGLSVLDIGDDARGATIRVDSFPQNTTQGSFICNGKT